MENEDKTIVIGENDSYYDGGYWSYIGHKLALSLGTAFTCGIAYPWLRCWYQRWLCSHTVISGKRMRFDGQGGELFGKYILWIILNYITCGIYSLWYTVNLKKWMSEHTFFENEPDNNSFFDGTVGDYFVTRILSSLAFLVPFAGPAWSKIIMNRWFIGHTVVDSRRLTFRGTTGDLFVKYLLWGILTTVTCGIFGLFMPVKYLKWETEYTLDTDFTPEALNEQANYKTQIHTDAVVLKNIEAEKLSAIRAEMLDDAKQGLALGESEEALKKLEGAVRLADLLTEADVKLNAEEKARIYECKVLARKIKAAKPIGKKSKAGVIVIAVIAAVLALSVLLAGVIVGAAFIFKAVPMGDFPSRFPSMGGEAVMESTISTNYQGFCYDLNLFAGNYGFSISEVATGVDGAVYQLNNTDAGNAVEVSVSRDDYGYVSSVGVQCATDGISANTDKAATVITLVYEALGFGNASSYSPYTGEGNYSDYIRGWNFNYENSDVSIYLTITK